VEFQLGQWVWLRLVHRPVGSLDVQGHDKLGAKFYGPYQIEEHIGDVAYKFNFLEGARLHNVFHVGFAKRNSLGNRPVPLRRYHQRAMVELARSQRKRSRSDLHLVAGKSWSNGRIELSLHPAGWSWAHSKKHILDSSSRELLLQGGEMSCSGSPTCWRPNKRNCGNRN
jgi:hypothetical protein